MEARLPLVTPKNKPGLTTPPSLALVNFLKYAAEKNCVNHCKPPLLLHDIHLIIYTVKDRVVNLIFVTAPKFSNNPEGSEQ